MTLRKSTFAQVLALLSLTLITPGVRGESQLPSLDDLLDVADQVQQLEPDRDDEIEATADAIRDRLTAPRDEAWMKDPLVAVEKDMSRSEDGLEAGRSDKATVKAQDDAIAKLEKLIALAQQGASGQGGGGSGNQSGNQAGTGGNSPMQDSMLVDGPGGVGALQDVDDGAGLWEQLSDEQRDKIIQSRLKDLPAGYEQVIEDYYRQLAEEQIVDLRDGATAGGGGQ